MNKIINMRNVADVSVLSSLGLGWVASVDWVFWTGFILGLFTVITRLLSWRESKRANDLKQRELDMKEGA